MTTIAYILIGFIIGYIASNIQGFSGINKSLKIIADKLNSTSVIQEEEEKQRKTPKPVTLLGTGRKGLMKRQLSAGKVNIDAVYEVYEIERSTDKSKIGIVDVRADQGAYNGADYRAKMKELYDKSWILSNEIEWLEESPELVRDEKLKDLLH